MKSKFQKPEFVIAVFIFCVIIIYSHGFLLSSYRAKRSGGLPFCWGLSDKIAGMGFGNKKLITW